MPFDADVIVAGAGPAGAVAARTLAAAGLDTLIVDRAAFPRNKPCGGGISVRVRRAVSVARRRDRGRRRPPDWQAASRRPATARRSISRAPTRRCCSCGASSSITRWCAPPSRPARGSSRRSRSPRWTWTSRASRCRRATDDGCRPRVVVAADSVHSVIAKRLGVNARWPRTSLAIDMMEETPVDTLAATRPDVLWVAYAYNGLDGYAYIFPKTRPRQRRHRLSAVALRRERVRSAVRPAAPVRRDAGRAGRAARGDRIAGTSRHS